MTCEKSFTAICKGCQVEFQAYGRTPKKYCTTHCRDVARRVRQRGYSLPLKKKCEICENEFMAKRDQEKYCSTLCRNKSERMRVRTHYQNNPEKYKEINKEWREKNKLAARKSRLRNFYGITWDEFKAILEYQDYRCSICKIELSHDGYETCLDHEHRDDVTVRSTVRGILCRWCNPGIGHFDDSSELFEAAIQYLQNPPAQKVISALERNDKPELNEFLRFPINYSLVVNRLQEAFANGSKSVTNGVLTSETQTTSCL